MDEIAIEMARRKKVFHANECWSKINLWGLFDYKYIKNHLKDGKLINHLNYAPVNKTYWVIPSEKFWNEEIKPIVDKYSVDELQDWFCGKPLSTPS